MQKDGTLSVPDVPVVPYITGDGVGAEVTPSMQAVVNAAVQKAYGGKRRIEWKEVLAGERAFNETGSWLPLQSFRYLHHISSYTVPHSHNISLRSPTKYPR